MTDSTAKPVEGSKIPMHASMLAHPDGKGKYAVSVSYSDGMVVLSVRHVERPWLPMVLFGRVIQTKLVRLSGEDVREVNLMNDASGLVCMIARAGVDVERYVLLGTEWPASLRESVRAEVDSAVHRKLGGLTVSLRGKTATLAGLFVAYATITGLHVANQPNFTAPGTAAPTSSMPAAQLHVPALLTPGEAAGMSSATTAQAAADAQTSLLPIKVALKKATSITLRAPTGAGSKALLIWSDPLCPHCRDFEQKVLAKLPANIGVTVIPVSFKHGSRPLVSYVACASTALERASRWRSMLSEQPTGIDVTQQCETGPEIADGNSALFARAGLLSTPTLMRPDGEVFEGDQNSVDAVVSWLAK